jgi:hypothetical protein
MLEIATAVLPLPFYPVVGAAFLLFPLAKARVCHQEEAAAGVALAASCSHLDLTMGGATATGARFDGDRGLRGGGRSLGDGSQSSGR